MSPPPDDAPLPPAYGSDTLRLMVRDPRWAHAYWDISIDRFNEAVGRGGGGRAFLRLIGVPTGYVLVEQAVWAAHGSHDFALPEADRSYIVELAIIRDYRWAVLARSNVIHAPPTTPRAPTAPAFAGGVSPRVGASAQAERAAVGRGLLGAPASMGSEVWPRVGSELRLAERVSEARLVRREGVHVRASPCADDSEFPAPETVASRPRTAYRPRRT
jgi:Domain of unknown function (DUF4912)